MNIARLLLIIPAILIISSPVVGQASSAPASDHQSSNCNGQIRSTYLLGPDDELEISGPELTEFGSKPVRIDSEGDVQAPLVGRTHIAGLTVEQATDALNKALSKYIREPQAAVNLTEVRSQPVSILGAVNTPGVYQVRGHKTLLDMLAMAGGIRPDAGYSVRITRELKWGCISLPGATLDSSGQFSVAELDLKNIMDAKDPAENIQILPHDVITVPKADMVYVIGDVKRSGGFVLGEHQSISVLQALALAEGLNGAADAKHAKVLRLNSGSEQREEVPVNVKALLKGKFQDVSLQAGDILFIPGSTGKKAALRAIEAAVQTGTGLAIWRVP
ncbi:MAG TPA: polysaccharide biosynthesis/export family protein [Candidatus Acidoferrales bacterium]|nr:polysaccharide biosynthesis/export family protein [Candidatus Acidoferrales bacterium]